MITINIRWKVIFEPLCWLVTHDWEEYAVIHAAWNWPGKYCTRCRKSIIRHTKWNRVPSETIEKATPWFSIKVS